HALIKEAVTHINSIDSSKFSRLLSRILQKLHLKVSNQDEIEPDLNDLVLILSLYECVIRCKAEDFSLQAVYHNLKPASLRQQLENISVQPEKAEVFAQVWASAAPDVLQKIRLGIFAPNKLDLVGWQLNLQMATSARSRLKAPHAVLNLGLRTEDDTERLQDVFVEFNHQDLLDFYNQMEMIQTQLDSLS
uniref:COMM domain-containing protein n=1 Tax=Sinocyclocheilus rhinocerous TaxID=307959 RepID=A0A673HS55_9TELE